jgi:hypothetical protein
LVFAPFEVGKIYGTFSSLSTAFPAQWVGSLAPFLLMFCSALLAFWPFLKMVIVMAFSAHRPPPCPAQRDFGVSPLFLASSWSLCIAFLALLVL